MSMKSLKRKQEISQFQEAERLLPDPEDSDVSGEDGSSESSDSEESVYSGLEEEADTSSEEGDGDEVDDDVEEEDDDESDEDESGTESSDEEAEEDNNGNKTAKIKSKNKSLSKGKRKVKGKDSKKQIKEGEGSPVQVNVQDEYEFDSSDEEDLRNTVGNVPMEWYKEFSHLGYDLLGDKIIKPQRGDQLDEFLNKMDNPDYWRSVEDSSTGQKVVLSDADAEFIKRYRTGRYVDPSYDPYQPWLEYFTSETMIHPVKNTPAHKRSFIPSLWEKKKVSQYVHAMKMGWMKIPEAPKEDKDEDEDREEDLPNFYELWTAETENEHTRRLRQHIPAPKLTLPGHAESYNPPPEYLLTEEEELVWKGQDKEERRQNFLPHKHDCLRHVPAYSRFMNERFERCLDLYLCPRQRKMRMNVNPEDLIPKLPKPRELQPFPTIESLVYRGHTGIIRCISLSPTGQWLASGSDDGSVRLWEVSTGRCMSTLTLGGVVRALDWNPSHALCLLAVAVDKDIKIINPGLGDKLVISNTDNLINSYTEQPSTAKKIPVEWEECKSSQQAEGFRLSISHAKDVGRVSWHGRGDYLVCLLPEGASQSVIIHQLSKRRSQLPFSKAKGLIQSVLFHPTRPFLFVASQRYVRVYNLLKQELSKKLMTNCKWVSSMAIHPGGDNLVIGSYDCRLSWFDLDLSTKPYQTLKHQKKAIRNVCFHKHYPLFASCSDDGTVVVCHGRVYNDLLQNPLIVPVKILRGHDCSGKELGVLDCQFHPTQPWIFSSGADNTVRLYT